MEKIKKLNLLSHVGETGFNKGIDPSLPIPCLNFSQCQQSTFVLNFFKLPQVQPRISFALIFKIGKDLNISCKVSSDRNTGIIWMSSITSTLLSVCVHIKVNKQVLMFCPSKEPVEDFAVLGWQMECLIS